MGVVFEEEAVQETMETAFGNSSGIMNTLALNGST